VIVLARGGGSFDDLLPFSDERLVRAVAACPVPVVSAVGHEQDTPLCDLAADVRASTPTAAGRVVVPDLAELTTRLDTARTALQRGARRTLERDRERNEALRARLRRAPGHALERERRRVDSLNERLRRAPLLLVERKRATLENATARLRVLSPKSTLGRGYAIVRGADGIVRSSEDVAQGEHVDVQLAEGGFGARVEKTR
jgi:exodeoxyribonuclease VII large subunit